MGVRRRPPAVAAAARSPARRRLGFDKAWIGRVEQVLGKALSNSHGAGVERSKGLGGGANRGRRGEACGSGWHGGEGRAGRPFIHASSGDDGKVSAVLRSLDRRAYGRHRGRTGGLPHARCEYDGVVGAVRGVLGQSERREAWASGSAWPRAEEPSGRCVGTVVEGRPAPVGDAWGAGARRHGALAPGLTPFCWAGL
jgi:hypothetical protein